MNEQEAIEFIKNSDTLRVTNKKATEAVRLSLEALEKQVAKKPVDRFMFKECPTCGSVEIEGCGYCPECGQKLDWSGEE